MLSTEMEIDYETSIFFQLFSCEIIERLSQSRIVTGESTLSSYGGMQAQIQYTWVLANKLASLGSRCSTPVRRQYQYCKARTNTVEQILTLTLESHDIMMATDAVEFMIQTIMADYK